MMILCISRYQPGQQNMATRCLLNHGSLYYDLSLLFSHSFCLSFPPSSLSLSLSLSFPSSFWRQSATAWTLDNNSIVILDRYRLPSHVRWCRSQINDIAHVRYAEILFWLRLFRACIAKKRRCHPVLCHVKIFLVQGTIFFWYVYGMASFIQH